MKYIYRQKSLSPEILFTVVEKIKSNFMIESTSAQNIMHIIGKTRRGCKDRNGQADASSWGWQRSPSVLAICLDLEGKQTEHNYMAGNSFVTWSKLPIEIRRQYTEVSSCSSTETRKSSVCPFLVLMTYVFEKDTPGS